VSPDKRYRKLFTNALPGIFEMDIEGRLLEVNPSLAAMFGFADDQEMLAEISHAERVVAEDADRQEIWRSLTEEGTLKGFEFRARHRDGSELWLLMNAWVVPPETGEGAVVAQGMVLDVTDRKRVEAALVEAKEQAEAADAARGHFLSRLSHELRTPLNAILGFGQLLMSDDLTESQRTDAGLILKAGQDLLRLVDRVLDITDVESGRVRLASEEVSIREVIAHAVKATKLSTDERGIVFSVTEPPGLQDDRVWAERARLEEILLILLSNAVNFNRLGGEVGVSLEQVEGDALRVRISDMGPGIEEKDLPRLFVPFDRLGAEGSDIPGTGLSLPSAQTLARSMGSEITVASEVGLGTSFSFTLKLIGGSPPRPDVDHGPDAGPPATPKIVCIEDNPSNLKLVTRILGRREDVELMTATTGELGISLVREQQPALVLIDMHLPDINGDAILARLRGDPSTKDIPMVMLSADASPEQITRLMGLGADAYVTKPLSVTDLLSTVDRYIPDPS
jgi:PAS domain S-box-containing protein